MSGIDNRSHLRPDVIMQIAGWLVRIPMDKFLGQLLQYDYWSNGVDFISISRRICGSTLTPCHVRIGFFSTGLQCEPFRDYSLRKFVEFMDCVTRQKRRTRNYEKKRIIVTQLAYEDGWSCVATHADGSKKDLKVISAQGGFVAFVSEAGDVSYSLDYYPPYLQTGCIVSCIGLFVFFSTMISYYYISTNKAFSFPTFIEELSRENKKHNFREIVLK